MADLEHLRLFIALSVDERVKDAIWGAQRDLRAAVPEGAIRWTRKEQLHLTLRFLGKVAAERTSALADSLRAACRPFGPLRISAAGIGAFPHLRSPRVLWVGVNDADGHLQHLWLSVQESTRAFTEEPPERSFTGHVTLGRVNRPSRIESATVAAACTRLEKFHFGNWTVDQLDLVRSDLLAQGARHTVMAQFPFLNGEQV